MTYRCGNSSCGKKKTTTTTQKLKFSINWQIRPASSVLLICHNTFPCSMLQSIQMHVPKIEGCFEIEVFKIWKSVCDLWMKSVKSAQYCSYWHQLFALWKFSSQTYKLLMTESILSSRWSTLFFRMSHDLSYRSE